MPQLQFGSRTVGDDAPPLVIAEIGINHEGNFDKARQMVEDAARAGCECVKFQCHVIDDEMIPAAGEVIPGNATESILTIMQRCALTDGQDRALKAYTEQLGMIYLSTPFSRAAADRLQRMGVIAYKIGSGECNNYPLVRHIAGFGRPVVLSTGMNDLDSVRPSVEILRTARVPFALLHCTSIYPTPYNKVRLGAITELKTTFPDAVVGLSDHTLGNYTCLAAVSLGARILERHFTSDKSWPGPDVPISMDPSELQDLVNGSRAVFEALGGGKTILGEEQPTIEFAYACVVTTREITKGEKLSSDNTWVKRPGTGEIKAKDYERVLGRSAARTLPAHAQVGWADLV
jgi:sialic acid synthase SpsE